VAANETHRIYIAMSVQSAGQFALPGVDPLIFLEDPKALGCVGRGFVPNSGFANWQSRSRNATFRRREGEVNPWDTLQTIINNSNQNVSGVAFRVVIACRKSTNCGLPSFRPSR
jgi:hypothetical protein